MTETIHYTDKKNLSAKEIVFILSAMVLFAVLEYGVIQQTEKVKFLFLTSGIVYFLKLYLYYGTAYLAFHKKTTFLAIGAVVVYTAALLIPGDDTVWILIADWSAILFGSVIMGRYLLKEANYERVYIAGLLAVLLCAVAMYAPHWEMLISSFKLNTADILSSLRTSLPAAGYSTGESATMMDSITNGMALTAYIIPALTLLSTVMQYSIGFLIFLYILIRRKELVKPIASFKMWKMPYYVTSVIIVGALLHFLGNEIVVQTGDNILVFLSVFYALTGLSLFEYFLSKIRLHWSMKLGMYLLLFFTAHIGYLAFVLLGFVDSFKDFRKIELLSLQSK